MIRRYLIIWIILFSVTIEARENPFAPAGDSESEPLTKPIPAPEFQSPPLPVIKEALCEASAKPSPTPAVKSVWKQKTIPEKTKTIIKKPERTVYKPRHKKHYRRIYHNENLTIYIKANQIKIITDDRLQKRFKLSYPTRVVLDFGDDFVIYPSIDRHIHSRYLKRLKIGTHDCFYRVVLVTEKTKRYRIQKRSYGYLISLF